MSDDGLVVYVVDDNPAVRDAVLMLLRSMKLSAETCASAEEFLAVCRPEVAGCLVLDIRMPGLSGLELQQEMARRKLDVPIVFLTGHGDIPLAVQAMQAGAVHFLEKQFSPDRLAACVREGLRRSSERRGPRAERARQEQLLSSLSSEERELLHHLAHGKTNSRLSQDLGVSLHTVQARRKSLKQKLGVSTRAELTRLLVSLDLAQGSARKA